MKIYPLENYLESDYKIFGIQNINMEDAVTIIFEQDEYLFHEGDDIEYILFILSGSAKVSMSIPSGKRMLLDYYIDCGVIGDLELFLGNKCAVSTMKSITELKCIGLPFDKYYLKLKSDISFLNWAGCELAQKFMRSNKNDVSAILKKLEPRLCSYILNLSHNNVFRENLTDVSELLGTSYRHLLRVLKKLCTEDIIQKQKTGYVIINEVELKNRAYDDI